MAIKFANMIGDERQARNIEDVANAWYKENPRPALDDEEFVGMEVSGQGEQQW